MATENSVIEQRIDAEEAEAEKIRAAMYATGSDDSKGGDDQPAKDEADTQEDKAGDDSKDGGAEDSADPDTAAKDATGDRTDGADAPDKDGQASDKEEESYKSKYLSLKGKYDKELPKAASTLKSVKAELVQWQEYAATLESRVKTLEEASAAPKKEEAKAEPSVIDLADPELTTLLGDYPGAAKLLKALEKERTASAEKIAELEAIVNSKLKTIESDAEVSKTDRFNSNMITLVGKDWKKIDTDPEFFEFLEAEVPYTGKTRLQFLKAASAALDATTVAQFFNDFLASKSASADVGAGDDNGVGDEGEQDSSVSDKLKKQLAPPRSGSASPVKKAGLEQVYTRKQYEKFMDDSTRGRFKPKEWGGKTEAEMDAIFDKALMAGTLK